MKTITIALLAIAMSAGVAQARAGHSWIGHKHMIPGCDLGHPAAATCACGMVTSRALMCQRGQWCHTNWACTS
jgi:hypothetical protein